MAKVGFGTTEEGKSKVLRGESLLLVVELHPGRRGKQGVTEVSRRPKFWNCTPEEGKSR